jgi:hypothetical protein
LLAIGWLLVSVFIPFQLIVSAFAEAAALLAVFVALALADLVRAELGLATLLVALAELGLATLLVALAEPVLALPRTCI